MKNKKHNAPYTKRTCVLCGSSIYAEQNYIVGATGRIVCKKCMEHSQTVSKLKLDLQTVPAPREDIMKPGELVRLLEQSVIGQSQAKQTVALALWKQLYRAKTRADMPKINLLLYGSSGCGKTAIVQKAAELVDLPFLVVDSTTLTETGYRGMDAADIPRLLYQQYHDHPNFEYSVVFVDEVDKLAGTGGDSPRAQYARGTQHALLKLIEGDAVTFEDKAHTSVTVSTQNFLFLFGGAFTALRKKKQEASRPQVVCRAPVIGFLSQPEAQPEQEQVTLNPCLSVEDFIGYGMEPELMGRIGQLIPLDPLDTDDLVRILCHSNLSAYVKYEKFLSEEGVSLSMSESTAYAIARQAEAQGLGARGMNAIVERLMEPVMRAFAEGYLGKSAEQQMEEGASA